jgi:anti-sigma B factor antagonist
MGTTHQIITQDVHLLKLSDALVGWRAEELERSFEHLKKQKVKRVVVDMTDVTFMDSRGLLALIKGLRIFGRDKGNLQLISPQTQPTLLLELTGFDRIVSVITKSQLQKQITRPQQSDRTLRPVRHPVFMRN